jgi:hypothetical protein
VCLSLAVLAGCGNTPSPPPVVTTPGAVTRLVPQSLPAQGISFETPAGWHYALGQAPLLATVNSGLVTVAVWRYPRAEPLPVTAAQLATARDALVGAAKARDPTFKVILAKGTRAAHHPAIVIEADETVAGQARRVRSTHIYGAGSEYVIDAFAPADQYARVETPVFRALVHSVKITQPTTG